MNGGFLLRSLCDDELFTNAMTEGWEANAETWSSLLQHCKEDEESEIKQRISENVRRRAAMNAAAHSYDDNIPINLAFSNDLPNVSTYIGEEINRELRYRTLGNAFFGPGHSSYES